MKTKSYTELTFFKGDLSKDGAVLRMNEIRILMKAAAELCGLQYQEDQGSYALFGPTEKMRKDDEDARLAQSKLLSKVDLCGHWGESEIAQKTQVLIKLAEEKEISFGLGLIILRAGEMAIQGQYSIKEWSA